MTRNAASVVSHAFHRHGRKRGSLGCNGTAVNASRRYFESGIEERERPEGTGGGASRVRADWDAESGRASPWKLCAFSKSSPFAILLEVEEEEELTLVGSTQKGRGLNLSPSAVGAAAPAGGELGEPGRTSRRRVTRLSEKQSRAEPQARRRRDLTRLLPLQLLPPCPTFSQDSQATPSSLVHLIATRGSLTCLERCGSSARGPLALTRDLEQVALVTGCV